MEFSLHWDGNTTGGYVSARKDDLNMMLDMVEIHVYTISHWKFMDGDLGLKHYALNVVMRLLEHFLNENTISQIEKDEYGRNLDDRIHVLQYGHIGPISVPEWLFNKYPNTIETSSKNSNPFHRISVTDIHYPILI